MWDEALKCPHLNPLREGEDVFSVALIYSIFPISLTPRFSEVHGRSATTTALAVRGSLGIINTQLKQGVN
jgi:hypothetical protein